MKTLAKENINISVDNLEEILDTDLADLCSVTEQAIRAGGGFGWLSIPPRDTLKNYWNGGGPRESYWARLCSPSIH